MRFVSTRGEAPPAGFTETLLAGLAPDAGLYSPATWPSFSPARIAGFAGQPYAAVAAEILSPFAGDEIAPADLSALCREAYAGFAHPAVTPLRQIAPDRHLLELFHGPSLAFKDVAMQLLARLYEHVLFRQGRRLTIVCATSGDTGGAAAEAFRGRTGIRLVVLFPEGRISDVQRRFITTAREDNVRAVAIAGDFDDCQAILKGLFRDEAFARAVDLSAVNSINIVRILAQSVYYFVAAAALGAPARAVSFAVPTGNFGDAFAGWAAHQMGLPIGRIVVATNRNDSLARALTEGRYARRVLSVTESPAMDIQAASNFERLYFEASGRDAGETRRAFERFDQGGEITLSPEILDAARERLVGVSTDEDATARTMADTWRHGCGLIDPHTAVALAGAGAAPPNGGPMVVLATAHPAKFPEAVNAATGAAVPRPEIVALQAQAPERFDRLPADSAAVKAFVREFALR
jgi:threonine synthase